jgi:DNA polymerase III alpha subunit
MVGHFHTHTHYSILDGAMTVDQLIQKASDGKIDAIAITETKAELDLRRQDEVERFFERKKSI